MLRGNREALIENPRLGRLDSNQDPQIQSLVCCHCTTPQFSPVTRLAGFYHKFWM
jgi:hypothetical protein